MKIIFLNSHIKQSQIAYESLYKLLDKNSDIRLVFMTDPDAPESSESSESSESPFNNKFAPEFFHKSREIQIPVYSKSSPGEIVDAWLKQHKADAADAYCIIDDDAYFLPEQMPFLVQVNGHEGLTCEDVKQVKKILKVKSPYLVTAYISIDRLYEVESEEEAERLIMEELTAEPQDIDDVDILKLETAEVYEF